MTLPGLPITGTPEAMGRRLGSPGHGPKAFWGYLIIGAGRELCQGISLGRGGPFPGMENARVGKGCAVM